MVSEAEYALQLLIHHMMKSSTAVIGMAQEMGGSLPAVWGGGVVLKPPPLPTPVHIQYSCIILDMAQVYYNLQSHMEWLQATTVQYEYLWATTVQYELGSIWRFIDLQRVDFAKNASFKSYGVICLPPLPSTLPEEVLMDGRNSSELFSR